MDIVYPDQLSVGDVIDGPDGPELIVELLPGKLYFSNRNHCMMVSHRERITRYVTAEVLKKAGVKL